MPFTVLTLMAIATPAAVNPTALARYSLVAAACLTFILCAIVVVEGGVRSRRLARALRGDLELLLQAPPESAGVRTVGALCGIVLVLLALVGLAAPVELRPGGYRLAALLQAALAMAGGASVLWLTWRRWSLLLAELGMGLITLAVCSLAAAFVPGTAGGLEERFPMVFNAMLIALALMTWLWGWLSGIWHQQLDEGRAWTTTGHLVGPASEFSFQAAGVGLIIALLMAVWPRLGVVGAGDDSLGRMLFGVAGHLLLILALLAGGRRTGRTRFGRVAALTVGSLLLFIGVRAIG